MGINKEVLHKDLIGIFEDEDQTKKAKEIIGHLLTQIKAAIDGAGKSSRYSLQDFLDATADYASVKEMIDLVKAYGGNSTAKAMLIAAIKEINE